MKKVLVLMLCTLALWGCAQRRMDGWNEEDVSLLTRELAADITGSPGYANTLGQKDRRPRC